MVEGKGPRTGRHIHPTQTYQGGGEMGPYTNPQKELADEDGRGPSTSPRSVSPGSHALCEVGIPARVVSLGCVAGGEASIGSRWGRTGSRWGVSQVIGGGLSMLGVSTALNSMCERMMGRESFGAESVTKAAEELT